MVIGISNFQYREIIAAPAVPSEILSIYSDIPVKRYRGSLSVTVKNGRFHIVNMVSEDDYLASVVGSEIDGRFPAEAKKAQAIVSRSLLYYLLLEKRREPSDLPGEFPGIQGFRLRITGRRRGGSPNSRYRSDFQQQDHLSLLSFDLRGNSPSLRY